jgi:hypothetical protein
MNASSLKREIEMLLGLTGPQAANFWRIAAAPPPAPPTPVPIPYPNFSSAPSPAQAAGDRFNGKYLVSGVTHRYSRALIDLVECVRAAAGNDLTAARIAPVWQRVKGELGHEPAHVRSQLGHELTHTLQQGGG